MVTVVAPFLNEINFAKAWAENVSRYADQVVVCDTGSTDGSRELLESYGFTVMGHKVNKPYDWKESWIRNRLFLYSKGDYIVTQDLDELVNTDFINYVKNLKTEHLFVKFPIYWFCYSLKTRKIHLPFTKKWLRYGREHRSIRIIRNNKSVHYIGDNHCYLTWNYMPKGSNRFLTLNSDIPIFHYHLFFPPKDGDNSKETYLTDKEPLVSYLGEHPEEIKYLCPHF